MKIERIMICTLCCLMMTACALSTKEKTPSSSGGTQDVFAFNEPHTSSQWEGKWSRPSSTDGAEMTISKRTPTSFSFLLQASSGANLGEVEGTATMKKEDVAVYSDKEGCELTFTFTNDQVDVSSTSLCSSYAGVGVSFSGAFNKGDLSIPESSLLTLGVFQTPEQDDNFQDVVGKDYPLFIERFQLKREENNLDPFPATVYVGTVRGLQGQMDAIVMTNDREQVWAAVIENEKIKYYTNVPSDQNKLPRTIDYWRTHFKSYPVVYKSK